MLWKASNSLRRSDTGRGEPVERSQRTEVPPVGTETTRREGLLRRAVVSGQDSCKEDSSEKSTGKAEGRECTAEKGTEEEMEQEKDRRERLLPPSASQGD